MLPFFHLRKWVTWAAGHARTAVVLKPVAVPGADPPTTSASAPPTRRIAPRSTFFAAFSLRYLKRRGWFTDWLSESREWAEIPATFRSWPDYEDRATTIRTWTPGIIGGLVQCEDYARGQAARSAARDSAEACLRGRCLRLPAGSAFRAFRARTRRRVSEGARRWSHGKRRAGGGGHATTNKKGIRRT